MASNRERGDEFQRLAADVLARTTGLTLSREVPFAIGDPPKTHLYDLASEDGRWVGECKAFSWTVSGNVPSAKITTLREAVQYLAQLPPGTDRFLIMKRSIHPKTRETLAEYFVRLNSHILKGIVVLEVCEDTVSVRVCYGNLRPVQ